MRKELEKILLTYGGYCSQQVEATDGDEQYHVAITSIINLVDKELPKDVDWDDINRPEGEPPSVTIVRMDAYNEAISDMRNKLRGE